MLGWNGVAAASQRFLSNVQHSTNEIPHYLGALYSAILELGSFLEQDIRLQQGGGYSADPLDPEVHRVLNDLIRTAAPWLRRFPTIRELDDESGAFLTRKELLDASSALVYAARDSKLVRSSDAAVLAGLVEAAHRGDFQGQKAQTRGIFSVRNLLYVSATVVAAFLANAAASNYSGKSLLIDHAGNFLGQAESRIIEFVSDLPSDLRTAFQELLKEINRNPDIFPPP